MGARKEIKKQAKAQRRKKTRQQEQWMGDENLVSLPVCGQVCLSWLCHEQKWPFSDFRKYSYAELPHRNKVDVHSLMMLRVSLQLPRNVRLEVQNSAAEVFDNDLL